MRTSIRLLAAGAAVLALGAASAASAAVFVSVDGTNTVATSPDGVYSFGLDCGTVNCGGFTNVQVSGDTGTLPTLLHSQNVDATTAAGSAADITVFVTRTNITSADFDDFFSSFTSNNSFILGAGNSQVTPFTVTMSTFIDSSNGLFDGTLVSSFSTSAPGATSDNVFASGTTGGGTFSVTEEYVIHANAFTQSESSSPSIVFAGAGVPEPTTWGLMIMGFGGIGAMVRGRRRQAAFA